MHPVPYKWALCETKSRAMKCAYCMWASCITWNKKHFSGRHTCSLDSSAAVRISNLFFLGCAFWGMFLQCKYCMALYAGNGRESEDVGWFSHIFWEEQCLTRRQTSFDWEGHDSCRCGDNQAYWGKPLRPEQVSSSNSKRYAQTKMLP